jgi:hypothetical protein
VLAIGAAVASAAAVALVWWRWPESPQRCTYGFAFTRGGTERGVLCVGSVLDTGAHEAELAIANIGKAELGAGTRVRLDQTSAERHELYLERGRLHARVDAPPRLFAVATASANVTDLGCEYTLTIDATGAGTITVQTGKVELATGTAGSVVVAPMRTHARLLPGRRPGLPVVDGAGQALAAAVDAFERGAVDGIDQVLATATPADALTVANLAELVPPAEKRRVLDRLAQLSAPPQELSVDDVLADHALYEMWFDDVILQHITNSP